MYDFAIWYKGVVIDHCKADTLRKATNLARKMFSGGTAITVTKV